MTSPAAVVVGTANEPPECIEISIASDEETDGLVRSSSRACEVEAECHDEVRKRADGGARPSTASGSSPATKTVSRTSPLIVGVSIVGLALFGILFLRSQDVPSSDTPRAPTDTAPPEPSPPSVYGYRIVQRYAHDPLAFTQGLFWLNGSLYESTGLYGRSGVREVRLDGSVVREVLTPSKKEDFGEGLVNMGSGRLLQILWRTGRGYVWDARAGKDGDLRLKPPHFHTALSDGWGLEYDGTSLIVTDSGPDLFFLDPEDYSVRDKVVVEDDGRPVEMVNELELIEGELWANIFGNECLARIDPKTGKVKAWVLLDGIIDRAAEEQAAKKARRQPPDVLNGIAWIPEERRLLVTGKLWPSLFEIELQPAPVDLVEARSRCIPKVNIFRRR